MRRRRARPLGALAAEFGGSAMMRIGTPVLAVQAWDREGTPLIVCGTRDFSTVVAAVRTRRDPKHPWWSRRSLERIGVRRREWADDPLHRASRRRSGSTVDGPQEADAPLLGRRGVLVHGWPRRTGWNSVASDY